MILIFLELKFNKTSLVNKIKIPAKKIIILIAILLINSLLATINKHARITNDGINRG